MRIEARVKIDGLASVLPERRLTSEELEQEVGSNSDAISIPPGSIELLTGVKERRVLDEELNASDLASQAGEKALERAGLARENVECLIFAAASGDIAEPATANIVQDNLGIECPVFDVKNACNSFLNGMEVAEALIVAGKYNNVLITNGEVPSRAVRKNVKNKDQLRKSFAGYTLGDAGAAMVLSPSDGERGILYTKFSSYGEHWRLCTVMGGGTRYPREEDKHYFEGETAGLRDVFVDIGSSQIEKTLEKVGWNKEDIDKIITHQVSMKTFDLLAEMTNLPKDKMSIVLPELGNMVSASVPVALDLVQDELSEGDKILLVGLAAGINVSTYAIIW